ncbi:unnamed protein product, partial [Rotaria magnacalcarata]
MNQIGIEGSQYFGDALRNNMGLKEFNIQANGLGDDGAEHIANALQHNT